MQYNKRASKTNKETSIIAKINDFITLNAFALFLLVLSVWYHQIFIVGTTVEELKANQYKMVKYLKENVDKVYFLSASGMAITATKSEVSYADERFKSYLINEIVNKLIAGNILISNNYKITYANGSEIISKNSQINDFYERLVKPHGRVMEDYARSLHRAIVEGRYPEYISVLSQGYTQYKIVKGTEKTNFKKTIEAKIKLTLLVKSWIRELKKWDTREVKIDVPFKLVIDVARYANIGNPFGIHFYELKIPIIHKPTATQVMEEKR